MERRRPTPRRQVTRMYLVSGNSKGIAQELGGRRSPEVEEQVYNEWPSEEAAPGVWPAVAEAMSRELEKILRFGGAGDLGS